MELSGQPHTPAALPPVKNSGTHWTGGWVSPKNGPDFSEKRKISYLCRGSNPESSSPYASHYTEYGVPK
jgi:hypothetical protein